MNQYSAKPPSRVCVQKAFLDLHVNGRRLGSRSRREPKCASDREQDVDALDKTCQKSLSDEIPDSSEGFPLECKHFICLTGALGLLTDRELACKRFTTRADTSVWAHVPEGFE